MDVVQKNSQVVEDEQIKELFRKKEYFCNQIQKVAGLGSYIFNAQTGAWISSPVLDKIFGIDKEYKRNIKNWLKIVSPDQRKEMEDYFVGKVLGNKERFDKEYKIVRINDGETRWIHGLGDLIFNKNGGVNQMIGTIQDITERKRYELALKKSEQKYRDLIANMLDAFVIVSMNGRIVEFNDIYAKMVGYKESELKKMTYVDLTPKKWHRLESKIINEQLLKNGFTDIYEKEYRRKDGSLFPVELRTYLIRDENGKPQSMWAIIRDISERKKIENKLIEEKEKLKSILENTRHGIALTDETAVFTQANPFFCKLLGYSEEELKKKSFKDITYPADLLESVKEVRQLQSGKIATINLEKRYVTKNKEIIWGKVNVSLVRDERGKIVNHVISLEDITSLKKVEEDLRKSKDQLSTVLMNMSDAVCVVDDKNRIILINKALERLSGYKESQLIGSKFGEKIVILSEKRGEPMFPEETFDLTKETELERGDGLLLTADKLKIPV